MKWINTAVIATLILGSCQEQAAEKTPQIEINIPSANVTDELDSTETKIQMALILDTSGSMEGLIEQAKNQLWKIVNEIGKASDSKGQTPYLEIALYEYGNDELSIRSGYVQKICDFTTELDLVSEKLFELTTNGGSEYCGTVIKASLDELKWSTNKSDLKMIFIAGNEPFDQGFTNYKLSCNEASSLQIVVNTIFCGDYQEGINTQWKDGARLGNGEYMNIDHDALIVHIPSPYDDDIQQLNAQLNDTYIPFGSQGFSKKQNQIVQDQNAMSQSSANYVKRTISKSGKAYYNDEWDLVDASSTKSFDIKSIDENELPTEMKGMTTEEKEQYIQSKKKLRAAIQKQIAELAKSRDEFVANEKAKNNNNDSQLEDALIRTIHTQAKKKGLTIKNN